MNKKTIYITSEKTGKRFGAYVDNAATSAWGEPLVYIWIVRGGTLGGFRLSRFEGAKLTPSSLRKFLADT